MIYIIKTAFQDIIQTSSSISTSAVVSVAGTSTAQVACNVSSSSNSNITYAALQTSNDGVTWSSAQTLSTTGTGEMIFSPLTNTTASFVQVQYTIASGSLNAMTNEILYVTENITPPSP